MSVYLDVFLCMCVYVRIIEEEGMNLIEPVRGKQEELEGRKAGISIENALWKKLC